MHDDEPSLTKHQEKKLVATEDRTIGSVGFSVYQAYFAAAETLGSKRYVLLFTILQSPCVHRCLWWSGDTLRCSSSLLHSLSDRWTLSPHTVSDPSP